MYHERPSSPWLNTMGACEWREYFFYMAYALMMVYVKEPNSKNEQQKTVDQQDGSRNSGAEGQRKCEETLLDNGRG